MDPSKMSLAEDILRRANAKNAYPERAYFEERDIIMAAAEILAGAVDSVNAGDGGTGVDLSTVIENLEEMYPQREWRFKWPN